MNNGYISLHRKILDWEWYTDANTIRLFLHLLLRANHAEKKWRGVTVKRGQLLTGRIKLCEELGITERGIRTSLTKLETTGEITIKTTSKFSIITVVNYSVYQFEKERVASKTTSKVSSERPTSDQPPTTNNNINNVNSDNKKSSKIDFEIFWKAYPKKSRKIDSQKKWKTLPIAKQILAYADCQKRYQNTENQFIPAAPTYLSGERWEDDPIDPSTANKKQQYHQPEKPAYEVIKL